MCQSALHAILHDLPDARDVFANFGFGVPGLLVFDDDPPDRHKVFLADPQQLIGAGKRIRRNRQLTVSGVFAFTCDEAAAYRIEDLGGERLSGAVDGGESHGVGVTGHHLVFVEEQVRRFVKRNRMRSKQVNGEVAVGFR